MKKFWLLLVLVMMLLSFAAGAVSFSNETLKVDSGYGMYINVSGNFNAENVNGETYSIFLVKYSSSGAVSDIEISEKFTVKEGSNSFKYASELTTDVQKVRAFVLASGLSPVCDDITKTVYAKYLEWSPKDDYFYNDLKNSSFNSETRFDKLYRIETPVTVLEGIIMASKLHASNKGVGIPEATAKVEDFVLEFDDPDIIVDMSDRNSRNENGVSFNRADGYIEDGVLIVTPNATNSNGVYDSGIFIEGLSLNAKKYNKMTFRMKRDYLPNLDPNASRTETVEIYFKTNSQGSITGDKCVYAKLNKIKDLTNWFEVEVELGQHAKWMDYITGIRFDPTNNNGVYYIDYIKFSNSTKYDYSDWYDKYVDYAIENGIIAERQFVESEFENDLTRENFSNFIVASFGEAFFEKINNIKGIPDVVKNEKFSEIKLLLYNSGIMTLAEDDGSFCKETAVLRSEAAKIINRIFVKDNREKFSIDATWDSEEYENDIEFDDESWLTKLTYEAETLKIKDGALYLKAKYRPNLALKYDPKIIRKNISFDASDYTKLRVRFKPLYEGEIASTKYDFYFMTEGDTNFSETKSMHQDITEYSYVDPAGWTIIEIDFRLNTYWKNKITGFRFDPGNTNGTYVIDYIRFEKTDPLFGASHETLIEEGFTSTRLMQDEHFERGFYVAQVEQKAGFGEHGLWQDYCDTDEAPLWGIGPWWIGTGEGFTTVDLWEDRDLTTDKYTLTDKYGINTIKYNPELKSVSMRQNATKIYNGAPHYNDSYTWWPHLLIEQNSKIAPFDKVRNSAAADRMFFEIDIRLNDYKTTTNPEGTNTPSFLVYYYLQTDKAPGQKIWFGFRLFAGESGSASVAAGWSPDSAAHQYMYGIPQAVIYDGVENSFNPEKGVVIADGEWKNVRLDITPHIERAVEWANRDLIFGMPVTVEDMYFSGVNIGFETHGNFDYEFEFKNFNMVSYNK